MGDPTPEPRDLKYTAALIGLITTGLYVAGYLAERSHWSLLGIADLPIDHIEFLYRGGNFAVSAVVGTLLFLWDVHQKLTSALLVYFVCIAILLTWVGAKRHAFNVVRETLLLLSLVLLLIGAVALGFRWPHFETNALFGANNRLNSQNNVRFFFAYSALTIGMWLDYITIRNRPSPSASALSTRLILGSSLINKVLLGTAITSAVCLSVLWPIVYGSFAFPWDLYPVKLTPATDAPAALKTELGSADFALVRVLNDDVLLMRQSGSYPILRIKRTALAAMAIGSPEKSSESERPQSVRIQSPLAQNLAAGVQENGKLLAWLRNIAEIRGDQQVALSPFGAIPSQNPVIFSWTGVPDAQRCLVVVSEEPTIDQDQGREVWRQETPSNSVSQLQMPLGKDIDPGKKFTWTLYAEHPGADAEQNPVEVGESQFWLLANKETAEIAAVEGTINKQLLQEAQSGRLLLLRGVFYSSRRMYSSAMQDFQQICGVTGQVPNFRTLATLISNRLEMQKQKLEHLTNIFNATTSTSERLLLIPDLVQCSADQLDYTEAIGFIDTALEASTGANKDEWIRRRAELVDEQEIAAKALN